MAEYYIGIMSGTSVDAVDAVLCQINSAGETEHLSSHSEPFSAPLSARLHQAMSPSISDLLAFKQLEHDYSELVVTAVNNLLALSNKTAKQIKTIGCHGQTLWHHPPSIASADGSTAFTLQLLNPALIAIKTGIDVVSDFRQKDIVAGGEGAPLVPAFHHHVFARQCPARTAILNLGGIANITYLGSDKTSVIGFDTGPANTLLDLAYRLHYGSPGYDKNGHTASQGLVQEALLQRLLQDPYFTKLPPKSTGREYFSETWLNKKLNSSIKGKDLLRTLLELTVDSIVQSLTLLPHSPSLIVACGGGVHNQLLMRQLSTKLAPTNLTTTADYGIDPQAVEAIAFAWLAWCYDKRQPGNLSAVTGAQRHVVLGSKTYAN